MLHPAFVAQVLDLGQLLVFFKACQVLDQGPSLGKPGSSGKQWSASGSLWGLRTCRLEEVRLVLSAVRSVFVSGKSASPQRCSPQGCIMGFMIAAKLKPGDLCPKPTLEARNRPGALNLAPQVRS